jgi:S-adenosylmethionine:tRNA ribosyltransferase-isomerase
VKTRDFSFDLPEELIAQHPAGRREGSRLLCLDRESGAVTHREMTNLPDQLPDNALLVLNDSRVRKARVFGTVKSGAGREFLFVRPAGPPDEVPDDPPSNPDERTWMVLTRNPSRLKTGSVVSLPGGREAEVAGHRSEFVYLRFGGPLLETYFETHGHVPLPPYIRREDQRIDAERYQTVYAANPGSVAAPTAGLHLTEGLLSEIAARGVGIARVTLHVGLGTFLPVRAENVREHRMHREEYEVGEGTATRVNEARAAGRPILAVGTTSVRTLESAYDPATDALRPGAASTDLFITPGYRFNLVTGMLTNFHTPESTLLMLVCAFAGTRRVLGAYREAVELRYRFFSYGDGMLIQ